MPTAQHPHFVPYEQRGECPMHPARWHRNAASVPFAAVVRCAHFGDAWVVQAITPSAPAPFAVLASDGRDWRFATSTAASRLFESQADGLRYGPLGDEIGPIAAA